MDTLLVGGIAFLMTFGGALLGIFLRSILPQEHLSADSKDSIKVTMAMIATLTALAVGLLIASAKNSFDAKNIDLRVAAARFILLDRMMAEYGTETGEIRNLLRLTIEDTLHKVWPVGTGHVLSPEAISRGTGIDAVQRGLLSLSPIEDSQRTIKSKALDLSDKLAETRWSLFMQTDSSIQWPFLILLLIWLALIFISFGLFAPGNASVLTALLVCSLSVAGSIYLIVQMDRPFSGLVKLSSAPLQAALDQLGRQ
jgi:hypothetical protein